MEHARRATALLLATGLGLGLAGCGGSDPVTKAPESKSPSSSTPTPTESSTPTPTPTPTRRPLSRFENEPVVKVTRKWAAGVATSINANDRTMRAAAPFSTGDASRFASYVEEEFGLVYPGPTPFTPVKVQARGSAATVDICLWTAGWGQKRQTKLPVEKREIQPVSVNLKRVAGAWKVDGLIARQGNCSAVPVKGIPR